jgi:hypothetical protein
MHLRSAAVALVVLASGCSDVSPARLPTIVEPSSPAIGANGALEQAVGLETLGGVLTPLLHVGCKVPCESTELFSTAADNQDQVSLRLFRGNAAKTADATPLGEYRIEGIPPMPRGQPRVEVRLAAENRDLVIGAVDAVSRRPYRVVRVGPPR